MPPSVEVYTTDDEFVPVVRVKVKPGGTIVVVIALEEVGT